jgi:hypothetical protein
LEVSVKITLTNLIAISILSLLIFACKKSDSSSDNGQKPYATCASASLACATNGACPSGQGYASDGVMTCDGTDNGQPCCAPCAAPNVVEDNACVFAGAVACANLGGYCASPEDDDASQASSAKCDPGSTTLGTPGMCGNGKEYPLADCCGDIDAESDEDSGAPDAGVEFPTASDASNG